MFECRISVEYNGVTYFSHCNDDYQVVTSSLPFLRGQLPVDVEVLETYCNIHDIPCDYDFDMRAY